jgi:hypothetical protein
MAGGKAENNGAAWRSGGGRRICAPAGDLHDSMQRARLVVELHNRRDSVRAVCLRFRVPLTPADLASGPNV